MIAHLATCVRFLPPCMFFDPAPARLAALAAMETKVWQLKRTGNMPTHESEIESGFETASLSPVPRLSWDTLHLRRVACVARFRTLLSPRTWFSLNSSTC
eukprot:585023-Rhodomonas_salina.3